MRFIKRLVYATQMGWQYRQQLRKIYQNTPAQQIFQLSLEHLQQQGVKILVLDFDGVLAAHGEIGLTEECQMWLQQAIEIFGISQIFILSNKPLPLRIAYFATNFPGVRCIAGVRKKPYPDGLQHILSLTAGLPQQILLADDRLLTGILAGCIAQVQVAYITRPYMQLRNRPLQESFFMLLRTLERGLMRVL